MIVYDRYQNYDSATLGTLVHQLCCQHHLRDLDGAGQIYPDQHWPAQIAEALRGLIHQAGLAREKGRTAIPAAVKNELITRFRDGVRVARTSRTHLVYLDIFSFTFAVRSGILCA
ncbi:MAG: IS66 family transposase [Pseudonocardiaceae bacterium]